jgi:membrane protein implicated in regulation of membrane protease activity
MSAYLIWAIAGLVLITIEMLTGTFYLLVIGIAALIGAIVAYAGGEFWLQALIAGISGLIGVWYAHGKLTAEKAKKGMPNTNQLDIGQPVTVLQWVNQAQGLVRVNYRGSQWDAKVDASESGAVQINDVLMISGREDGVFLVSAAKA